MKIATPFVVVLIGVLLIGGAWYFSSTVDLGATAGEQRASQTVDEDTAQIGDLDPDDTERSEEDDAFVLPGEVQVTNGLRHSVELDQVIGGGPAQDGIPSIDDPQFVSVTEADDFLDDNELGIAISKDGVERFYPFQILVWHEIVNDTINGERVLVTYCPLCFSGIVFDPVVNGERVEFGTSGKLWQSNLVMYDRKTDTYWSQVLGEAIVGDRTGDLLEVLPSDQLSYGAWKEAHANGQVLSRDTGAVRFYGQDPYGDYYTDNDEVFFGVRATDDRLERKDFILGVLFDGEAKAYLPEAIKAEGEVTDQFAGRTITLRYIEELDVVRMFEVQEDGTEERINPFGTFWFSWVAAHPNTDLYQ